jgi:putative transposase
MYLFDSIREVQEITDQWLEHYNFDRPHQSLGYLPPREFAAKKLYLEMR